MKLVNQALNKLRLLLELKGLKNRCLLLKNAQDLTDEEKEDLEKFSREHPIFAKVKSNSRFNFAN